MSWEFYLANSYDLSAIERVTGAIDKKFSPAFNRPGSFSITLKIDDPAALKAQKWKHCLYLQDPTGEIRWSGPVTAIVDTVPADTTTLTAQGWQVELDYRWVRPDQINSAIFVSVTDSYIAKHLLDLANAQVDSNGLARPTHLTSRYPLTTAVTTRTRSYPAGQNIGAAIKELCDIENGFDITVDPKNKEILFVANDIWVDQTQIAYGYNTAPNNVAGITVNDDGTKKANSILGQGAFITGVADSPADIDDVGIMLEDWLTISDVKDSAIVGAYANSELVYRVSGEVALNVTPLQGSNVPIPFIDYDLGDKVYLSADRGRMQFDHQGMRVFTAEISWDAQNQPVVDSLGLTPS